MSLWPRPADETPPPDADEITREVHAFGRGRLPAWEAAYLDYHRRRYQGTLRLLPRGEGRRPLDVGSFPGHLSARARPAPQGPGWTPGDVDETPAPGGGQTGRARAGRTLGSTAGHRAVAERGGCVCCRPVRWRASDHT